MVSVSGSGEVLLESLRENPLPQVSRIANVLKHKAKARATRSRFYTHLKPVLELKGKTKGHEAFLHQAIPMRDATQHAQKDCSRNHSICKSYKDFCSQSFQTLYIQRAMLFRALETIRNTKFRPGTLAQTALQKANTLQLLHMQISSCQCDNQWKGRHSDPQRS